MKLQKILHKKDNLVGIEGDIIVTHVVNEIELGGEYTICGLAIPDSVISIEGWCAIGKEFKGNIKQCNCNDCLKKINYFKSLK